MVTQPVYRTVDEALDYVLAKPSAKPKIAVYDKGAMVLGSVR